MGGALKSATGIMIRVLLDWTYDQNVVSLTLGQVVVE